MHSRTAGTSATVTIANVAPTLVLDPAQETAALEFGTIPVRATFSDPGVLDNHTASITCYAGAYGTLVHPGTVSSRVEGTQRVGTIESPGCQYGDNDEFTVRIVVRDEDGGGDVEAFHVTVANVAPSVVIDGAGTTRINGQAAVLAELDTPVDFAASVSDPGSDVLTRRSDWDDGST
jgi:hypothetical protein